MSTTHNNNDALYAMLFLAGVAFVTVIYFFSPERDSANFVEGHPGVREMVAEMREACETKVGVVSCEWDADKHDFVPADD